MNAFMWMADSLSLEILELSSSLTFLFLAPNAAPQGQHEGGWQLG